MAVQLKTRLPVAAPVHMEAPVGDELSWLEIDLGRVEQNARALRAALDAGESADEGGRAGRRAPKLCPVLKKDAYGLGAVPIAHRLARAGLSDLLAVYSADEAQRLVAGAVTTPILVLMPMRSIRRTDGLYRHAVAEKLHLSIHDTKQMGELNDVGQQLGIKLPCHLYVDTGMSRSGLSPAQALALLQQTASHRYVRIAGIFTHFADAEHDPDFTRQQLAMFRVLLDEAGDALPKDAICHAANSASLLRDDALHLDMARTGIAMLGYATPHDTADLQPVMRWCSRVIHAQHYPEGTPVSYGSTHNLMRDSVLGIVPVGHGDGYPVALSNKATVRVNDHDCRVIGTVSMDQIVVDLTDVSTGHETSARDTEKRGRIPFSDNPFSDNPNTSLVGQVVEVYSNDPATPHALPALAKLAGTNAYELLCRLSPTLLRKYAQG